MPVELIKGEFSEEAHKALAALDGASAANTKKINDFLDKQEEANQKLISDLAVKAKTEKEAEDRMNVIEVELKRLPIGNPEVNSKKEELKAYHLFMTKGDKNLSEAELKFLRTDVDPDGGFLVPVEQDLAVSIKKITEISNVRAVAKVRTLNAKTLRLSTRSTLLSGGWAGEAEEGVDSNSTYGREELTAKKLQVSSAITVEELQDATPNMISEINSDVVERFAQLEGLAFVNGDSNKKPEGFMINEDIPSIDSGQATTFDFDNLIDLTGELKKGYDPIYAFNRQTLAFIRKLKDDAGNYIWRQGNLGAGIPNAINGDPYIILQDMPSINCFYLQKLPCC